MMKQADPRVKLLAILLSTSFSILFTNVVYLLGVFFFSILLLVLFGADYKLLWNKLRRFIYILIGVSIIQIIFVRTGAPLVRVGEVTLIYEDGFFRGISMALRFFTLISSAAIMASENSRRVIASLSKLKIPYTFSFMIMLTLRFIPFFMESFTDAMVSIQLRGIEVEKIPFGKRIRLYGYLLSPVVADAIIKSQDLAMAMESRGFGAMKKRTTYIEVKMSAVDVVSIIVLVTLSVIALYFYYMVF